MPQVKNAVGPFHSRILPPRATQMDEVQGIIPLLYMNGLSTWLNKKNIGQFDFRKAENILWFDGGYVDHKTFLQRVEKTHERISAFSVSHNTKVEIWKLRDYRTEQARDI